MRHMDDLQTIPGVGKSIAQDLRNIGIHSVKDLRGKDPEKLYDRSNRFAGVKQDRCLLYVFRCGVYFAETKQPKANLLKWWNWSDKNTVKFLYNGPYKCLNFSQSGRKRSW